MEVFKPYPDPGYSAGDTLPVRVQFQVKADVRHGEQVCVSGNCAALGGWDLQRPLRLACTHETYPVWTSTSHVAVPSRQPVQYRYCIFSGGKFSRWERIPARSLPAGADDATGKRHITTTCDLLDTEPLKTSSADKLGEGMGRTQLSDDKENESFRDVQGALREVTPVSDEEEPVASAAVAVRESGIRAAAPAALPSLPKKAHHSLTRAAPALPIPVTDNPGHGVERWPSESRLHPLLSHVHMGSATPSPNLPVHRRYGGHSQHEAADVRAPTAAPREAAGHEKLLSLQKADCVRTLRVGTVRGAGELTLAEEEELRAALAPLGCVPVFLPSDALEHSFYQVFCKGILWPMLHHSQLFGDHLTGAFLDTGVMEKGWAAYREVNKLFRDKVVEVFNETDLIWVHGFHLLLLPSFLSREIRTGRIGLFLHTPFPSSEHFRMLPQREVLLRAMLSADQIGFHRFECARHFLGCCRRLLGRPAERNEATGQLLVVYMGRPVEVTVLHAGVDSTVLNALLNSSEVVLEARRIREMHDGKFVFGSLERLERVKGAWLNLIAFRQLLEQNPCLRDRVVLHQIGIAAHERGADYEQSRELVRHLTKRVNEKFGNGTAVFEEMSKQEAGYGQRLALMSVSDAFLKTPVRDGLTLPPLEYRLVQDRVTQLSPTKVPGTLILSCDTSCATALQGALLINPWILDEFTDAMKLALSATPEQRWVGHVIDAEWCHQHTPEVWVTMLLKALKAVEKSEDRAVYKSAGLGLDFRMVEMLPDFHSLEPADVLKTYRASSRRVIILDYGGTLAVAANSTPENEDMVERFHIMDTSSVTAKIATPGTVSKEFYLARTTCRQSPYLIELLSELCSDSANSVFVISGRSRSEMESALGHVNGLGLAAEHGFYCRWPSSGPSTEPKEWEKMEIDWEEHRVWRDLTLSLYEAYQYRTHGSYIEEKGCAMLWHYCDADPEFGLMQAYLLVDQLKDELTDILKDSSVKVDIIHEDGKGLEFKGIGSYVEVRPHGVTKGCFAERALRRMSQEHGLEPDFCLCMGDDVSDEDMFLKVEEVCIELGRKGEQDHPNQLSVSSKGEVYRKEAQRKRDVWCWTCTVGLKQSNARYYCNDVASVLDLLEHLGKVQFGGFRRWSSEGHEPQLAGDVNQRTGRKLFERMSDPYISEGPKSPCAVQDIKQRRNSVSVFPGPRSLEEYYRELENDDQLEPPTF